MSRYQYQMITSWSPIFGGECARISMTDENNGEFFVLLPFTDDKAFRTKRDKAIKVLGEAIENGEQPGEFRW